MEGAAIILFMLICFFLPSFFSMVASVLLRSPSVQNKTEYIYVDKVVPEYIFVGGKYPTIEDAEYIRKPKGLPQKVKPKHKLKSSPVIEISSLHRDAIQCLISLGMKKSEASKKVSSMMSVKNYSTIEDFLMDVYKK